MLRTLANFVSFQIGWFGCVLTMAKGLPFVGITIVLLLVGMHVWTASSRGREIGMVLVVGLAGAAVDTLLSRGGWVVLESHGDSFGFVYLWFVAFWANFATALNRSLGWLQRMPVLAVVFGAVGGPAAYFGAAKLGALSLPESVTWTSIVLGVYWGVAMPLVLWLARRLSDEGPPRESEIVDLRNGVGA